MSATYRSIARLPLSIFTDLIESHPRNIGDNDDSDKYDEIGTRIHGTIGSPELLRAEICKKLKNVGTGSGSNQSRLQNITTVGELLKMSPPAILRALDPLLTHYECEVFMQRVYSTCSSCKSSSTALQLFQNTASPISNSEEQSNKNNITTYYSNTSQIKNSRSRLRHLPSDVKPLDQCLGGGFRVGTITEIVGRAGVGKTQLVMQLCVTAARLNQGCIFIDTEKKLSLQRLEEIADERARVYNHCSDSGSSLHVHSYGLDTSSFLYDDPLENDFESQRSQKKHGSIPTNMKDEYGNSLNYKKSQQVLENITVHSADSLSELISVVSKIEEEIALRNEYANIGENVNFDDMGSSENQQQHTAQNYPVRIVILDSIAAAARRDFDKNSCDGTSTVPQRVSAIFQLSRMLKRIADQLQVAVVVINQVGAIGTDNVKDSSANYASTNNDDGSDFVSIKAALGMSWYHCVTTRLLLEHERDPHRIDSNVDIAHTKAMHNNEVSSLNAGSNNACGMRLPFMSKRGHLRTATVVKSNAVKRSRMVFEVTQIGISAIS